MTASTREEVSVMTYVQQQRARVHSALEHAEDLRCAAFRTADTNLQAELVESARDWVRHADRITHTMHAQRKAARR